MTVVWWRTYPRRFFIFSSCNNEPLLFTLRPLTRARSKRRLIFFRATQSHHKSSESETSVIWVNGLPDIKQERKGFKWDNQHDNQITDGASNQVKDEVSVFRPVKKSDRLKHGVKYSLKGGYISFLSLSFCYWRNSRKLFISHTGKRLVTKNQCALNEKSKVKYPETLFQLNRTLIIKWDATTMLRLVFSAGG